MDVAKPNPPPSLLSERDLSRWKLVEEFRERLNAAAGQRSPGKSERDPRRKLLQNDYFSLVLFALLNPGVDTMRGICEASHFGRLQEEVCRHSVSLGSFSEAQAVVDLGLLQDVFLGLSQKTNAAVGRSTIMRRWRIETHRCRWDSLCAHCLACIGRCWQDE